jgi:hypothetical protein
MLFLLGMTLLLVHVFVPTVSPALPVPLAWATLAIGWVGVALMAYAVVTRIARKQGPLSMTVLLVVLVLLAIPAAISNGASPTIRGYACVHNHHLTFLGTNRRPPAGCQPLQPGGTFPNPY